MSLDQVFCTQNAFLMQRRFGSRGALRGLRPTITMGSLLYRAAGCMVAGSYTMVDVVVALLDDMCMITKEADASNIMMARMYLINV